MVSPPGRIRRPSAPRCGRPAPLHKAQELVHGAVLDAELVEMAHRVDEVLGARTAGAVALADELGDALELKRPGVLRMAASGDVGVGVDAPAPAHELDRNGALLVDVAGHLALVEIGEDLLAPHGCHAVGDAAAGAARLQAEHQARQLGRAAIAPRVDAEGAMVAAQEGRRALEIGEARVPHERAVAEDPELSVRRHRRQPLTRATPAAAIAMPAMAVGASVSPKRK